MTDQLMMGIATASFSAAGWKGGRYAAYKHALLDVARPQVNTQGIIGAALLGAGLTAVAVDAGLMARCLQGGGGPYDRGDGALWSDCGSNAGALAMDFGGAAAAAGGALLGYSLAYRRDRDAYDRGRVVLSPTASRERVGLQIAGRF